MARLSNSKCGVTFVLYAAVLTLLLVAPSVVQAGDNLGSQAGHLAQARQHGRMIRVRKPPHEDPNGGGGQPTPTSSELPSDTPQTSTSSQDPFSSLTSVIGGALPTTTTTTSSPSSTPPPITTSSVALNTTSSSAPNTTTTTSTTSTTSSSSTTSTTETSIVPGTTSTVIVAVSSSTTPPAETPTGNPSAAASQSVAIARKTIVVLVSIAGSIGLAFLIWTGIRKWKFRPSRGFEDRMQDPINWQPNAVGYDDSDPAYRIAAHRRHGSTGSHGSFGSGEGSNGQPDAQYSGYGATGATGVSRSLSGRNAESQHPPDALPPLPPHDFTAGAHGSDAYHFYHGQGQQHMLGTSSSPPQMVENGLTRGNTITRPVSVRSEDPYDGLDEDYNHQPPLPPHHGGAYAAHNGA